MGRDETPIEAEADAAPLDPHERAEIIRRAQSGDRDVLPRLKALLDENAGGEIELLGNIQKLVERDLISTMAGKNLAFRAGMEHKLAQLREELAGPDASPIERLLAERVVFCWVIVYDYERDCANSGNITLKQAEYYQRRIDAAHRRFLSALKALASIRRLPLRALQVNVGLNQVNQAGA
jgi:hypothetical protein